MDSRQVRRAEARRLVKGGKYASVRQAYEALTEEQGRETPMARPDSGPVSAAEGE